MSDSVPEIKREYLGNEFSDEKIEELKRAAKRNKELQQEIENYNQAVERSSDPEFYRDRLEEMYQRINTTRKVAQVRDAVSQKMQQGENESVQSPVMKAVVVEEYDGRRIWIEPESMVKGQYGVELPSGIAPDSIPAGTEIAVDPQSFEVVEVLEKKKDARFEPASTEVTFSDIGGLDSVIDILRKNIGVQLDEEKRMVAEGWDIDTDKAVMLVGQPGTGKTMLAKAVANEFDAEIFSVNAPQLVEKFIGEGAKKIKKLYSQASSTEKPSIVFIDEIDAIAKARDGKRRHGGEEVERTMSQLLSELDGLGKEEGDQNIVSVFATNKPSVLDPAIMNRCSAIEVPVPGEEAKEDIFRIHTRGLPISSDVEAGEIVEELGEDYTGRDIAQVCKQAAISSLFEVEEPEEAEISSQDFFEAIKDLEEGKMGMETDFLIDEEHPGEIFA
ncbi:MAG: AAA family ATPase [Candidatus Nanohaloarchaeota archaeon QJJ-7]|nr:AAA family ATPase [Candidatus Nanohaloarchaeota archaeon QJJ-7]